MTTTLSRLKSCTEPPTPTQHNREENATMAALLDIKITRKVTITCSLEESTANQVDLYAAFAKVPADDVVNKALEYVFTKDRDFQQFKEANPNEKAPAALRVKKPVIAPTGAKRGRKPSSPATH